MSTLHRTETIDALANHTYDLLVVGGGITGAGIALDAASRGLKVALVEKQDFAEGTSSRSTKLIHGGLRYLKQGEIRLVREVGRERAILHRNAPHVVHAERMLLPIVQNGTYGRFATSIGLWLYDRLAGVKRTERRVMLNATQTVVTEPLLNPESLLGGGLYYEYRTDDARLTIEVMKTAVQHGATCINHTEVTEFLYENQQICGARVKDCVTENTYSISAKKIVNATGPWVDALREQDKSRSGKQLHLTKGVHLVVPFSRLPLRQSVYFDTPDGRMIFAIPRQECTYIGTTDTDYHEAPDSPTVTPEDVAYLLPAVNHMFPQVCLTEHDIVSSWAGLRPLIHEEGKSPSELSRKDEVFLSHTGLISIAGGKLTGYRKMAERVVNLVMKELAHLEGIAYVPCKTDGIVLSGGEKTDDAEVETWLNTYGSRSDVGPIRSQVEKDARALRDKYGSNTGIVLHLASELLESGTTLADVIPFAELSYSIEHEGVVHLCDFLVRRTGRLWFDRHRADAISENMAVYMQQRLDWSDRRRQEELSRWEAEFQQATRFVHEPAEEHRLQSV